MWDLAQFNRIWVLITWKGFHHIGASACLSDPEENTSVEGPFAPFILHNSLSLLMYFQLINIIVLANLDFIYVQFSLLLINVLLVDMRFTRACSIFQCFSVNDLYQQSCDYAMSTLDAFSNTSVRYWRFSTTKGISFRQSTFIITHFPPILFLWFGPFVFFSGLC